MAIEMPSGERVDANVSKESDATINANRMTILCIQSRLLTAARCSENNQMTFPLPVGEGRERVRSIAGFGPIGLGSNRDWMSFAYVNQLVISIQATQFGRTLHKGAKHQNRER